MGRAADRPFGRELPMVSIVDIPPRLRGDETFDFAVKAKHTATVAGDRNNLLPNFLVRMIAAGVRPRHALKIGTGLGVSTCQIAA